MADPLARRTWLVPLCGAVLCWTQTAPAAARPNVLVVLADDAGYGDFSLTGNRNLTTPTIDAIARDGAVLGQFMVQPFCAPTRAEFLTGRWYPRTGVRGVTSGEERMAAEERTIAQVFHEAGYATGCFGKWHNGTQWPFHPLARGFDTFYGFTEGHWGSSFDAPMQHDGRFVRGRGYITDDLATHAIAFIREARAAGKPFFCYLPFNTPHTPLSVPDADWERVRDRPIPMRGPAEDAAELPATRAALAMVENLDRQLGRVLAAVDDLGLGRETIVVFFSDNGPNGPRWNAGLKGSKGSTDEGGVRSVCCVRYPARIAAGTVVGEVAAAVDLLPSLAALADVPVQSSRPLDGVDLSPLLVGSGTAAAPAGRAVVARRGNQVSVRTTRHRLDAAGRLYDMLSDPGQTKDIASDLPDEAARLRAVAAAYRRDVMGSEPPVAIAPLTVGFPGALMTELTAGEAVPHGGIVRSGPANCSFLTRFTAIDQSISWRVDVLTPGRYDVDLWYTVAPADVGADVRLTCGGAVATATIAPAWDPPLEDGEDRVRRREGYDKEFRPLRLGTLDLTAGPATLRLEATAIPGTAVGDFRRIVLTPARPLGPDAPGAGSGAAGANR